MVSNINKEFEENNKKQRALRLRLLEEISKSGLSIFWIDHVLEGLMNNIRYFTPAVPDIDVLRAHYGDPDQYL